MAEVEDCHRLAPYFLEASGGIFQNLLGGLLPDATPETLMSLAIVDEESTSGYSNILLGEIEKELATLLCAYDSRRFGLPETLASFLPPSRLTGMGDFFSTALPSGWYLQTVCVASQFRGQGLGKLLLEQAEWMAQAQGFSQLLLHVWEDNSRALHLYKNFGFQVLQQIDIPAAAKMGHHSGKLLLAKVIS